MLKNLDVALCEYPNSCAMALWSKLAYFVDITIPPPAVLKVAPITARSRRSVRPHIGKLGDCLFCFTVELEPKTRHIPSSGRKTVAWRSPQFIGQAHVQVIRAIRRAKAGRKQDSSKPEANGVRCFAFTAKDLPSFAIIQTYQRFGIWASAWRGKTLECRAGITVI
jgi:hypothetical protein